MNSSKKNDAFNGVNTQVLNTVYNAMQNQPEMAKATFLNPSGLIEVKYYIFNVYDH